MTLRQPHRCGDPLIGARAGRADAAGRIGVGAAALGLGAACGLVVGLDCAAAQDRYRLALYCLAQRRFIDAHNPGHFGGPLAFGLLKNAQCFTDSLRAVRKTGDQHLVEHGRLLGPSQASKPMPNSPQLTENAAMPTS